MSGALVWTDEASRQMPIELNWALRFLWGYRTSLTLGEPRKELSGFWEHGLSLFPRWIDFRPARRTATPKLLRINREGDVSLRRCLRRIERDSDTFDINADATPRQ